MYQRKSYEEAFTEKNYQVLTKLENDALIIAIIPTIRTQKKMYFSIPKYSYESDQSWDLKALRKHIKETKNIKILEQETALSIMAKSNFFGRDLNLEIIRVRMNYHEDQKEERNLPVRNINKQNLPQQREKKAIIVVGRMGHGKSSFINTLILPKNQMGGQISEEYQQKLLATGGDLKSVTTQCSIVQIHQSHHLLDQKLYAIDTPGLNSEHAICVVAEQIDNIIVQKKMLNSRNSLCYKSFCRS